jgi:hypothetical protein
MAIFSRQVDFFLKQVGADPFQEVSIVPKSDSCAVPGDVLFFRYQLGSGKGSRASRIFLIIEPITKEAKTGNLLLTGFKLPDDGEYTPASLEELYKKGALPKENYRTYIMGRIYGPLRRIRKVKL